MVSVSVGMTTGLRTRSTITHVRLRSAITTPDDRHHRALSETRRPDETKVLARSIAVGHKHLHGEVFCDETSGCVICLGGVPEHAYPTGAPPRDGNTWQSPPSRHSRDKDSSKFSERPVNSSLAAAPVMGTFNFKFIHC